MSDYSEQELNSIILEILHLERKNLRSKALTDQRMSEEIQKIIISYLKTK